LEKVDWGKLIDSLIKQGILHSPPVIKAMRTVPRTKFLPSNMVNYTTADTPLPIGFGQTISAPHMVSIMNEALNLKVGNRVLEVGAGSGWHSATIAEIIAPKDVPRSEWGHIYTIEIVQNLAENARKNIMNAGYGDRVTIISGDGSKGYSEKAPYDRVIVTAAAPKVPKPLVDQLKTGGILVIPVGTAFMLQNLLKLTKDSNGKIIQENLGGVAFVPLTGEYGHQFAHS
jgi:protein-L-isoaspartate(D-aspartate) O-methyltransferase